MSSIIDTEPCDYCRGAGGGYVTMHWAPLDETRHWETCPKCHGTKVQKRPPVTRVMQAEDIGLRSILVPKYQESVT